MQDQWGVNFFFVMFWSIKEIMILKKVNIKWRLFEDQ